MPLARALSILALLTLGLLTAACQQAPGLHREFGTYSQWMAATPDQVVAAAHQAIDDMNMHVISSSRSPAQVVARTAHGVRVTITARPDGDQATRVGVKVEPGQGEEISRTILDRIHTHLPPK